MLNTIAAYHNTKEIEKQDESWIYGNSRNGRDVETTLASSPIASPGPLDVAIFVPSRESSRRPSPELVQVMDGENDDSDLYADND